MTEILEKEVTVKLPVDAVQYLVPTEETLRTEQHALMMYPYIKNGLLSHGRVAEILNMNKYELISIYARFGIPYINLSSEELNEDIETCLKVVSRN